MITKTRTKSIHLPLSKFPILRHEILNALLFSDRKHHRLHIDGYFWFGFRGRNNLSFTPPLGCGSAHVVSAYPAMPESFKENCVGPSAC